MSKETLEYGYKIRMSVPYKQAIERVTEALKAEGFGVLTQVDVKDTLRQKLGAEFREYVILGACNPPMAHKALSAALDVGLLLPCNVIVYEEDGGSIVGILDPISMLGVIADPALEPVAMEARARLKRVAEALEG